MTKEEIVKKRAELDQRGRDLEKEYRKTQDALEKEYRALYKQCPHEEMNGASYCRWCCVCGESWDTT